MMLLTRDFTKVGAFTTVGELEKASPRFSGNEVAFYFNVGICEYYMSFRPFRADPYKYGDNPPYRVDFMLSNIRGTPAEKVKFLSQVFGKDVTEDFYKYENQLLGQGFNSLTGIGNPLQVLSIVFNKVKEFVGQYKPPWMFFSATGRTDAEINKKTSIYKTIMKRMFPGVQIKSKGKGDFRAYFR